MARDCRGDLPYWVRLPSGRRMFGRDGLTIYRIAEKRGKPAGSHRRRTDDRISGGGTQRTTSGRATRLEVDLEESSLQVRRTLAITKNGPILTSPKTTGSRRSVKLTGKAIEALKPDIRLQDGRTPQPPQPHPALVLSRFWSGRDYRRYASTISGTRAPLCYSPAT
jgi:hypothetical protein